MVNDLPVRFWRSAALVAVIAVGVISLQSGQLNAQQPPNRPATGTATISGTVRVGEFLTVHTSDIADDDGMTNVSFAYSWLLEPEPEDWSVLARLYDKRGYLVPPDAAGRTIKAIVAFRDDRGYFESVVSAPTVVVAPTVPDPPRNLAVAYGGPRAQSVEWEAPVWSLSAWLFDGSTDVGDGGSPITSYTVQWREDTGSWSNSADVFGAVVTTGTTYTISDLTDGVTYAVRVIAANALGDGEPSAEAEATSSDRPPIVVGPIVSPGGGGPSGPTPSDEDFEWTVDRDIEELDGGNDEPTGAWSNGTTLWVADNPDGAGDAVYAYDLASGERVEEQEFELDETNRAPRGAWSDKETIWVSDSGQERLFAYDLATGERIEDREIVLAERNDDPRGIWSDGVAMWVLDDRANALFAYSLGSGDLLAEYELHEDNDDPHGIWSDGVTVWVSNHNPKRLFAYRLPVPEAPGDEDVDALPLERVRDEEFDKLSRVRNNSPRGIWSNGDVMYVADRSDDKVYSYNMPDAIDARLASLTLSGIDIGEFDSSRPDYEAVLTDGLIETTVEAVAVQDDAEVAIDSPDTDQDADGHQVTVDGGTEITVTVISPDGSREKVYRVALGEAGPSASCLSGAIAVGFGLVVYEGGSIEDLAACARSRNVVTLYAIYNGEYVPYILGGSELANARFGELYAGGVPALTPLVAQSDGPTTPAPVSSGVTAPWAECLHGEIGAGFTLVIYEGGSVDELDACAVGAGVAALYVLNDSVWVSYILSAPELVNRSFRELFPDGLPVATPLLANSAGPSS